VGSSELGGGFRKYGEKLGLVLVLNNSQRQWVSFMLNGHLVETMGSPLHTSQYIALPCSSEFCSATR